MTCARTGTIFDVRLMIVDSPLESERDRTKISPDMTYTKIIMTNERE